MGADLKQKDKNAVVFKKYLTCLERKILSQSSQHVMLSPSVKAIEFTALLASIGFFWSFLAEFAGPGLGLLLGPGFLLGAGAGAAGDESLDFSEADPAFGVFLVVGVGLGFFLISESESDLFAFFCTLASST